MRRLGELKTGLYKTAMAFLVPAMVVGYAQSAQAEWAPERPVEIMVTTAPGSGPDTIARTVQSIWQEHDFLDVPVSVVNRPGGGGSVGFAYLNQHQGDGHYLTISSASAISNYLVGGLTISVDELTPISLLLSEYVGLGVAADSPIEDGADFLRRLEEDPDSISIGMGGSRGSVNHLNVALAAKAAGLDPRSPNIVIFGSGGEARTALIGGHIEAVTVTAGSMAGQVESGLLRILAVSSPERLGGALADAPTWREQDINAVTANWRWAGGPGGLSDDQIAFWEDIFRRTVETEEWQEFAERAQSSTTFMGHEETMAYFAEEEEVLRDILGELDLLP